MRATGRISRPDVPNRSADFADRPESAIEHSTVPRHSVRSSGARRRRSGPSRRAHWQLSRPRAAQGQCLNGLAGQTAFDVAEASSVGTDARRGMPCVSDRPRRAQPADRRRCGTGGQLRDGLFGWPLQRTGFIQIVIWTVHAMTASASIGDIFAFSRIRFVDRALVTSDHRASVVE